MSQKIRKRSPNWLPQEKLLLLTLVEEHFAVVENKKTDGVSMKQKLAEWALMAGKYNSQTSHCPRTAENLKAQWESMKKSAKKEEANNRMQRIKTGGGPPTEKKEDPIHTRILGLIETATIGLFNPYDCDSVVPINNGTITWPERPGTEVLPEVSSDNEDVEIHDIRDLPIKSMSQESETESQNCEVQKDWGDYTPALLRTPLTTSLRCENDSKTKRKGEKKSWITRRRPTHTPSSSSLEQLHLKKIEVLDFQKNIASEERDRALINHNLDIELKKEALKQAKLKTRLMLLEARLKKKQLKEKKNCHC